MSVYEDIRTPIATGNLLPASVHTVCVDINPAVVTKLANRGSFHTIGVVTGIGLFLGEPADDLGRSEPARTGGASQRGGTSGRIEIGGHHGYPTGYVEV